VRQIRARTLYIRQTSSVVLILSKNMFPFWFVPHRNAIVKEGTRLNGSFQPNFPSASGRGTWSIRERHGMRLLVRDSGLEFEGIEALKVGDQVK